MFGEVLNDKRRGLSHVYVQYFENISKWRNQTLSVVQQSRMLALPTPGPDPFWKCRTSEVWNPTETTSNQLSCMSARAHDTIHDVTTLADATFWKEGKK